MRRYYFDLNDTHSVVDAGGALLDNDSQALKIAQHLVQEVRQTRPQLIGQGYEIVVRSEAGDEVLRAAIDTEAEGR